MGLFTLIDNDTANVTGQCSGSAGPFGFKRLTNGKLIVTNATASFSGTPFESDVATTTVIASQYFFQINPGFNVGSSDFRTLLSTWQDVGALDDAIRAYNELNPGNPYQLGEYGWLLGTNALSGDVLPKAYFYGSLQSAGDLNGELAFLALANSLKFSAGDYTSANQAWEALCGDISAAVPTTPYVHVRQTVAVGNVNDVAIVTSNPF
jgi:hypothetical protein